MADPLDLKNIRPGDTVLVRCIVKSVTGNLVSVETDDGDPEGFTVLPAGIADHVAEPRVGDRVTRTNYGTYGELLLVHSGHAVVKFEGGTMFSDPIPISELERV